MPLPLNLQNKVALLVSDNRFLRRCTVTRARALQQRNMSEHAHSGGRGLAETNPWQPIDNIKSAPKDRREFRKFLTHQQATSGFLADVDHLHWGTVTTPQFNCLAL